MQQPHSLVWRGFHYTYAHFLCHGTSAEGILDISLDPLGQPSVAQRHAWIRKRPLPRLQAHNYVLPWSSAGLKSCAGW